MEFNNIVRSIAQNKNIDILNYIENNLEILLNNTPIFVNNIDKIDIPMLYDILDSQQVDFDNIFKILNIISIETCLKLLYYSNFFYNTLVLSIILIKLLNYEQIYNLCLSKKPFNFIKQTSTLTATIIQLKQHYIYIYNENIKCKCFNKTKGNDFLILIQSNYFNFNINILLDSLKKLILTLEQIYTYYNEYYIKEKEFYDMDCKNQQEHMIYEEDFSNFSKNYRKNIKMLNINYTIIGNIGNIDNIIKFIF